MTSQKKSKTENVTPNLTSLITNNLDTALSLSEKESLARLLTKVILPDEYHKCKNRPYELPKDFQLIFSICLELKEKSDENYKKIHRIFLRCKNDNWDKVSFFDINDTLYWILSIGNNLSDDFKEYLRQIRKLCQDLDYLSYRYYNLLNKIFPKPTDEKLFKKNIFLFLSVPDKRQFLTECNINSIEKKIDAQLQNPYTFQK